MTRFILVLFCFALLPQQAASENDSASKERLPRDIVALAAESGKLLGESRRCPGTTISRSRYRKMALQEIARRAGSARIREGAVKLLNSTAETYAGQGPGRLPETACQRVRESLNERIARLKKKQAPPQKPRSSAPPSRSSSAAPPDTDDLFSSLPPEIRKFISPERLALLHGMGTGMTIVALLLFLIFLFLPTLIALYRRSRAAGLVFLMNILFGLTGLGWIVALLTALFTRRAAPYAGAAPPPPPTDSRWSNDSAFAKKPFLSENQTADEKICPRCAARIANEKRVCPECNYRFDQE